MKYSLNNLIATVVLVAGIAGTSPALMAAGPSDPVSKLLSEATANSSQISVDWKSYAHRSAGNWTSEGIVRIKDDIAAAARTIAILNEARAQASPSQAITIDRVIPVMEEIVDNTSDAVEYLNQTPMSDKEYKQYVEASSDTSNRLAGLIAQIVELGNNRDKFENAKRTLELAAK